MSTISMITAIGAVVIMAVIARAETPTIVESDSGIVVEYTGTPEGGAAADKAGVSAPVRRDAPRRSAWLAAEIERLRGELVQTELVAAQEGPEGAAAQALAAQKKQQIEAYERELAQLGQAGQNAPANHDNSSGSSQGKDGNSDQQRTADQPVATKPNYQTSRQDMKQQIRTLKMQRNMNPTPLQ
ncbi:hypothetical protein GMLC_16660 [Geomonas limicola]|uniref:Uncharacterized protein n=1 Tax=Geomonas limicola TaxID=2740186 RepID=A0A6V8N8J3_9BACT|nr:hypothetical protein [Geomonas limicola]GFO68087.1 hypothetical protein GMLC_16660 [Geomonas limicola]